MIDTKDRIVTAALNLFALHGYEKTTMKRIAKEVGVTSAAIYYFFSSKEAVLEAILSEVEASFHLYRNDQEDILEAAKTVPLSKALSMVFYSLGNPSERERTVTMIRVILSLQTENARARDIHQNIVQDVLDYRAQIFEALYHMGKIKKNDFERLSFVFHSFGMTILYENIRLMRSYTESNKAYQEGVAYFCSLFASVIGTEQV